MAYSLLKPYYGVMQDDFSSTVWLEDVSAGFLSGFRGLEPETLNPKLGLELEVQVWGWGGFVLRIFACVGFLEIKNVVPVLILPSEYQG